MSARTGHLGALVAAIVLVAAVSGGVGATTGGVDSTTGGVDSTTGGVDATTGGSAVPANESATRNATTPHENPDEIREEGDDRRVSTYLASRLGDRLTESAIAISAGEYERGRVPLDEEYGELLDRYGEVARDLDEEEIAARFNLTREQQRSVIASIEELEATRAEYERAVEAGDEERRRELARELLEGAAELNRTATELDGQYAALGNETEIDFEEARSAIEDAQLRIGQAAAVIERQEFTATRLAIEANRTTASVSEPVSVTGRLTTANGTPIEDGSIRLRLGADSVATRTGENGTFAATYRPLLASTAASNLTVAYAPAGSDRYLPATETVPLSIGDRANTSVTLAETTESAAFTETVRATGTVRVEGAPEGAIGGIPVVLTVDGRRLGTAETGPNGEVDIRGILPASVPAGETELAVAIDRRDAAIARSIAAEPITVRSTPTALSIDATPDESGRNVTVTGALRTEGGTDLAGREVAIAVGGTELTSVETDVDGRYRETLAVPDDIDRGESVAVTATFNAGGTNLEGDTATRRVTLSEPSGSTVAGTVDAATENDTLRPLLVGGVILLGALLVLARRSVRRWGQLLGSRLGLIAKSTDESPAAGSTAAGSTAAGAAAGTTASETEATASERSPFDRARSALSAGRPDDAVRIAYAAMRSRLGSPGGDGSATHWEFYRRRQEEVDETRLQAVTEAYETAAFAPDPVSTDAAGDAVTASDELSRETARADRDDGETPPDR